MLSLVLQDKPSEMLLWMVFFCEIHYAGYGVLFFFLFIFLKCQIYLNTFWFAPSIIGVVNADNEMMENLGSFVHCFITVSHL